MSNVISGDGEFSQEYVGKIIIAQRAPFRFEVLFPQAGFVRFLDLAHKSHQNWSKTLGYKKSLRPEFYTYGFNYWILWMRNISWSSIWGNFCKECQYFDISQIIDKNMQFGTGFYARFQWAHRLQMNGSWNVRKVLIWHDTPHQTWNWDTSRTCCYLFG